MTVTVPPCETELKKLYDAIMALQSGDRVTSIGFGERQVSYGQGELKGLQMLYRTFWRSCGAASGLPDLSDQAMVERGSPAVMRYV